MTRHRISCTFLVKKRGNLIPSCSTVTFTSSESIRGRHEKSLLFLSDFNKLRNVSSFRKNPEYKISLKSFHSESRCSTRTDRETDWSAPSCDKWPENRPFRTHQMKGWSSVPFLWKTFSIHRILCKIGDSHSCKCDVTSCCPAETERPFGQTFHLHLHNSTRNMEAEVSSEMSSNLYRNTGHHV